MPAIAAIQAHAAKYSLLEAELPDHGLVTLGVLLQDAERDRLHLRLRRDLDLIAGEDSDVFSALAGDLTAKAQELGTEGFFAYLEDTLSNTIRISGREPVLVHNFEWALNRLFRQHVESSVRQFETHLPLYSLRAAAGRFLENEEVSEEGWEEIPENLREKLYPDMFVAHIAGNSMEPRIPDGSLCLFRAGVLGSRAGRLVLVEDRSRHAFSIKRYASEWHDRELKDKSKSEARGNQLTEGGERRHKSIRLESLNLEAESWTLDPEEDKYRVLAEFICVLG